MKTMLMGLAAATAMLAASGAYAGPVKGGLAGAAGGAVVGGPVGAVVGGAAGVVVGSHGGHDRRVCHWRNHHKVCHR